MSSVDCRSTSICVVGTLTWRCSAGGRCRSIFLMRVTKSTHFASPYSNVTPSPVTRKGSVPLERGGNPGALRVILRPIGVAVYQNVSSLKDSCTVPTNQIGCVYHDWFMLLCVVVSDGRWEGGSAYPLK